MVQATKAKTNGRSRAARNGNGHTPGRIAVEFPELRGEENADGDRISNADSRYGVPVPIGATVLTGQGDGVVIGGTDQLAIIQDEKGWQYAERWGVIHVQASGPAFDV